jgi:hypothetical protein
MAEPTERWSDDDVLMARRRRLVPTMFFCLAVPALRTNFLTAARKAVVALLGQPLVSKVIGWRCLVSKL